MTDWLDLLLYVAGAAVLGAAVRWWRPRLSGRWVIGYGLLVLALFALPLATSLVHGPVDLAYQWYPWKAFSEPDFEPQNRLLADIPLQMLPFRTLVRERLLALEAPLWAHELGTGQPLLGNSQSSPFAPLHLMTLPVPPQRGLTLAAAWQVLVGMLLMHALALALLWRSGGDPEPSGERPAPFARQAGAATAAVAFALSAYSVAWLYHPHTMVAMFLPGLILGVVALARGEPRAFPGLVACAAVMAVNGHPETVAHAAVAVAGLGLVLLVRGPEVGRLGFAGRAAAAGVLAFALAAPVVLPVLEALPESERMSYLNRGAAVALRPPEASVDSFVPLVQPLAFGSPRDGDWDGPVNFNEFCTHYAGLLTLALAVAGAAVFGGRILAILGAGALALGVALNVGPIFDLFILLPGMDHAANARLRLFWVLAVALAAGLTVARLASVGRRRRLGAAAVALALVAVAALVPPVFGGGPLRAFWWAAGLGGTALVAAALVLPRPGLRRASIGAVPVLILLDLVLLGVRYQPLVEPEHQLRSTPMIDWLQERSREADEPFRVLAEGWDLLPNLGAVFGLWDPRGNDPMRPARPLWLLGRSLGGSRWRPGSMVRLLDPWPRPMLAKLGVRYVMDRGGRHPGPPWRRVFAGRGGRLFEHPSPLSLFYVPERVRAVDRPARARGASIRNDDFSRLAVYTARHATDDAPWRDLPGPRRQAGEIWLREVRANGFELVSRSRDGALVASSVSDAPGWRLRIDGDPVPTLPVDYAFVGFRVPAGVHRVQLEYRPAGWTWGWMAFWAAVVACVGWAARRTESA